MLVLKETSKEKRKRLSESRQGDRKQPQPTGFSSKKAYPHNRSSSMHREKKELRFNTDYGDYEQSHTANFGNYTKFQKKLAPARRRDTFDCEISDSLSKHLGVQSTKYNPNKNLELKGLFKPKD